MPRYINTDNKICGTCKYHLRERNTDDYCCDNVNSFYFPVWTKYNDTCEDWEEK